MKHQRQNSISSFIVAGLITLAAAYLAVALRFISRRLMHIKLEADDWMMVLGLVCPDFEQPFGNRHFWRMEVLHAMRCCRLFCLWVAKSGPKFTASNVTHYRSRRLIGTRRALYYTYEARCLCSGNFNHADPVRTSSYLYQILGLAPVPSSLPYQKAQDHVLMPRRISYCVYASSESKCHYSMQACSSSLGSLLLPGRRLWRLSPRSRRVRCN